MGNSTVKLKREYGAREIQHNDKDHHNDQNQCDGKDRPTGTVHNDFSRIEKLPDPLGCLPKKRDRMDFNSDASMEVDGSTEDQPGDQDQERLDSYVEEPPVKGLQRAFFNWRGGGKEVFLAGSFNKWSRKIPLLKSVNNFCAMVELPEGDHDYKFLVDGHWRCSDSETSHHTATGCHVNCLTVNDADRSAMTALCEDCKGVVLPDVHKRDGFNQNIPSYSSYARVTPPELPAYIKNGSPLNEAGPESEILPVPKHVVLNHLYCDSIRNGVIALTSSVRHRNTVTTTILYKPLHSSY